MQHVSKKNAAIAKSGVISDAWDIFISYAGRAAGWILFGCMICNIIQLFPAINFIPATAMACVMAVEVITLDIAGFGLNTIAKIVLKMGDVEAQMTARGAKKLASCLIGMMVLTLILVTIGLRFPAYAGWTSGADNVLIIARIVLIVVYMHTMHSLREAESEIKVKADHIEQANDELALSNQRKMEDVSANVYTLADSVDKLVDKVDELSTAYTKLAERVDNAVDSVYKTELDRLSQKVNLMSTSVNQTNQTVLQITQNTNNLYGMPERIQRPQPQNEVYTAHIEEVQDDRYALPETAETLDNAPDTDSLKALPVPVLDVPGVSPDKVEKALIAYLSSGSWRDVPYNYSRITIHVRRAYEAYQQALSTTV